MIAKNCYMVTGGIMVMLYIDDRELENISEEDIAIEFADYGLNVIVGDNIVPIPEAMFDYITENRNITIYAINTDNYFIKPTLHLELPKDSLVDAKGAYRFWIAQRYAVENQAQ